MAVFEKYLFELQQNKNILLYLSVNSDFYIFAKN